jgi:hypothetical protein
MEKPQSVLIGTWKLYQNGKAAVSFNWDLEILPKGKDAVSLIGTWKFYQKEKPQSVLIGTWKFLPKGVHFWAISQQLLTYIFTLQA